MTIYKSKSTERGSCNGCNQHIDSFGMRRHIVYVIQLNGTEVRVCEDCKQTLIDGLRHS